MRLRGILALAVLSFFVVTAVAGADLVPVKLLLQYASEPPKIPPGQERIEIHLSGSASQWQSVYSPSGELETHTVAKVIFFGSCSYLVDVPRVRAGYVALCDAARNDPSVGGSVSYTQWNPNSGAARSCLGLASFRRGAQWLIGGTLGTGNVMNAESGAPLIDSIATPSANQLVVKSNDAALGCTQLGFASPQNVHRDFGSYRINRLMPFPGHASNNWKASIGTSELVQGSATFDATLDVDVERGTKPEQRGGADGLLDAFKQWWNGEVEGPIPPPGAVKIDLTPGGLQLDWTVGGVITHAPRQPAASRLRSGGTTTLFTLRQSLHGGLNTVTPQLTPLGRAVVAGTASAPTVTGTATFTPVHGTPVTVKRTFGSVVLPAITSVQFTGGPANPTVIVRGRGLTPLPPQDPVGSPAGHNGCPAESGKAGSDFGLQLGVDDLTKQWGAGMSTATNTSCIGLIPTKVTPGELDLRLGSFYSQNYPKFTLAPGDRVQVVANGAGIDVHVAYGAPVTR